MRPPSKEKTILPSGVLNLYGAGGPVRKKDVQSEYGDEDEVEISKDSDSEHKEENEVKNLDSEFNGGDK